MQDVLPQGNTAESIVDSIRRQATEFGNRKFRAGDSSVCFGLRALPYDLSLKEFPSPVGDAFRILDLPHDIEEACADWIRFEPCVSYSENTAYGNLFFKCIIFVPGYLVGEDNLQRFAINAYDIPRSADPDEFSDFLSESAYMDPGRGASNGPNLSPMEMIKVLNYARNTGMMLEYRIYRESHYNEPGVEEYTNLFLLTSTAKSARSAFVFDEDGTHF